MTSLYYQNCTQNSLAQLHVPSKMASGTPHMPLLEGGLFIGVVVVTFTDIVGCDGGSKGKEPCRDIMGSRAAARTSSSESVWIVG